MKIATLPRVKAETTIGAALKVMKKQSLSSVAFPGEQSVRIFYYGDLVVSELADETLLTAVEPAQIAPLLTPSQAQLLKLPKAGGRVLATNVATPLQRLLRREAIFYVALPPESTKVGILALSDRAHEKLVTVPKKCYCRGLPRHSYDHWDHPEYCPHDETQIYCRK
jgi:hypothetical protein